MEESTWKVGVLPQKEGNGASAPAIAIKEARLRRRRRRRRRRRQRWQLVGRRQTREPDPARTVHHLLQEGSLHYQLINRLPFHSPPPPPPAERKRAWVRASGPEWGEREIIVWTTMASGQEAAEQWPVGESLRGIPIRVGRWIAWGWECGTQYTLRVHRWLEISDNEKIYN